MFFGVADPTQMVPRQGSCNINVCRHFFHQGGVLALAITKICVRFSFPLAGFQSFRLSDIFGERGGGRRARNLKCRWTLILSDSLALELYVLVLDTGLVYVADGWSVMCPCKGFVHAPGHSSAHVDIVVFPSEAFLCAICTIPLRDITSPCVACHSRYACS